MDLDVATPDVDLVGALHGVIASLGAGEISVLLADRVTAPTLAAVLALPGVRSAVLAEPDAGLEALAKGRAGCVTSPRFDWRAPAAGMARELVFVGAVGHAGVHFLRTAHAEGIRGVTFLIPGCAPERRPLGRLLGRRVLASVSRRVFGELRPTHGMANAIHRLFERRYRLAFQRLLEARYATPLLPPEAFAAGGIAIVVGSLGPGGAERQVIHTALGLHAAGDDVTLLCERLGGAENRFHLWRLEGSGVRVAERRAFVDLEAVALPPDVKDRLRDLGADFGDETSWLAPELLWWICELVTRRPAVVHVWLDATNVKVGLAAAISGVPRIVLSGRSVAPVHFDLLQPFMRPGYQTLLARANVSLLNNSQAGAADYARWLGIAPERIEVVPNAAPPAERPDAEAVAAARRALGVPAGAPVIGSLLRFSEEKRPLLFVRTAAALARARPDVWFVMIGDGPLRAAAQRLGASLGLGARLCLPGAVRDPAPLVAGFDLFVLTSRLEGLPNAVIEAQALGVPVVTTDAGGAREAIDPGRTGALVSPHEPRLLAERISAMLGDSAWMAEARRHAPAFVARKFGLARMVAETRSVYRAGPPRQRSTRMEGSG